jgi:hypothetical protein
MKAQVLPDCFMAANYFWQSLTQPARVLTFLDRYSKTTQIPYFTKVRTVGVELFRADGKIDMMKLIERA